MRIRLLVLALSASLAGCAAVQGFPKPAFDPHAEDAELRPYVGAEAMTRYEQCPDKAACRNAIIDARLHAVDLAFYRFQRSIYSQEGRVSLGTDGVSLVLDSLATVTGTRALAAGAGAVTGSRDAYKKEVLSISLPLLFEEMIANKRELLLRIRQSEALPVQAYSLFEAFDDIGQYELAGSIPAAASKLGASAGAGAAAAQAKLDALRAATAAAYAVPQPVQAPAPAPSAQSTTAAPGAPVPIIAVPRP